MTRNKVTLGSMVKKLAMSSLLLFTYANADINQNNTLLDHIKDGVTKINVGIQIKEEVKQVKKEDVKINQEVNLSNDLRLYMLQKNHFTNNEQEKFDHVEKWLDEEIKKYHIPNLNNDKIKERTIKSAIIYNYLNKDNKDSLVSGITDVNKQVDISSKLLISVAEKETGVFDYRPWMKAKSDRSNAHGTWQILPIAAAETMINMLGKIDLFDKDSIPKSYYDKNYIQEAKQLVSSYDKRYSEFEWDQNKKNNELKNLVEFSKQFKERILEEVNKSRIVLKDGEEITFKQILKDKIPGKNTEERIDNLVKIYINMLNNDYTHGVLALEILNVKNTKLVKEKDQLIAKKIFDIKDSSGKEQIKKFVITVAENYNGDNRKFTYSGEEMRFEGKTLLVKEEFGLSVKHYFENFGGFQNFNLDLNKKINELQSTDGEQNQENNKDLYEKAYNILSSGNISMKTLASNNHTNEKEINMSI